MIIPSIDLMDGKAVQLQQGKKKVLERADVLELARDFSRYGEIAVIDLDAAMGTGRESNISLVKQLCRIADCRVGGGIRTVETANELLSAGAKKVIIGTKASPEFLKQLPKDRVIAAIDVKDGFVVNQGWTVSSGKNPEELIKELEPYCSEFLFTDVEKEGMMEGFDFTKLNALRKITSNKMTAAGGITSIMEINELENSGINSQIGMALYTGRINLADAFISLLDFEKSNGLIPTIVQEAKGQVLMLAFSSRDSLLKSFSSGKAAYYSRSRGKVWTKGETSGNFQQITRISYDCDKDSLLFTVRQKNGACHLGRYSCFGDEKFEFESLYDAVNERIMNPSAASYTSKIAADDELIKAKIMEESKEVANYKDRANLIWEISDLIYFLIVLMAKKDITTAEIKNELWRRRK
ncbi:bifunctional phosphoribosyl-AMP cyclohydrolase/phosphoribosyl-ATP diphosphatase HisIE [Candidatus Woesearchaeota archaeon]|nr:bifunctional phosphoribosyl-AMP cyclohydrolase/phosphoribosyl-ATP diphosphatase HisIE [Candidatus Woesearchaeota archaeon]